MSYNGSGTFLINTAGQPVVSGTVISSTAFNALTADLATGLSTAITKDGQTTVTANIPMGTYKFTGLGAGTAATDSANLSQVQSTVTKLLASVSGADTITAVASPTLGAYAAGQMFYWVAAGDNTGAVTLNIDSLGAKSVTRDGSVALAAGDIKSGEVVVVVYDGTRFQVVSQINSSGNATFANVSITSALNVGGVATFSAGTAAAPSITTSGDTNNGIFFPATDVTAITTAGSERLRVDASGNLGLGVTPSAWGSGSAIQLADTQSYSRYGMIRNAYYDGAAYRFLTSAPASLYQQSADEHAWYSVGTGIAGNPISFAQAMTLNASGRLLVGGTTAPSGTSAKFSVVGGSAGTQSSAMQFTYNGGTFGGALLGAVEQGGGLQFYTFTGNVGSESYTERARITSGGDLALGATATSGNSERLYVTNAQNNVAIFKGTGGGLAQLIIWNDANKGVGMGAYASTYGGGSNFSVGANGAYVGAGNGAPFAVGTTDAQPLLLGTNNAERARITSGGDFCVGTTNVAPGANNVTGAALGGAGYISVTRDSNPSAEFNRKTNDGDIVRLQQDGVQEGSISVSGNTVSYNAFAGSHWSQLQDGSKPDILRGTVMESINELCVWPGEQNERLPKAKISDTAGSKKVYGVFMAWDNDWTETNDMYVTAVGAFICRVNGSVTVQEGDLLESNGDGTARVQADDIIRSSTIGKVTSTVKTHEYDDGSYCVPTVLYCG